MIWEEFWKPLVEMAVKTGMATPARREIFLATGALSPRTVVSREHAGVFFLGWRCLYAAIVESRIDDVPLNLEKALRRCVAMIISRIRSYEFFWRRWVRTSRYRKEPNVVGQKHQDKKVLQQQPDGSCVVHDAILQLARDLGLKGNY